MWLIEEKREENRRKRLKKYERKERYANQILSLRFASFLILMLLTGCTNQNPVQTTQENTTDIRTMDQTENESEEISASLLEESVTVEKLQADSEKNLAQMQ